MILDLIVIGLVAAAFFISARKGLIRSIRKIAALIITIVLVTALRTPTAEFLAGTNISDNIYDFISERLTVELENPLTADIAAETEEAGGETSGIPRFILNEMEKSADAGISTLEASINRGADMLTRRLTAWALNIIATVALFILIRIILMMVFTFLDGASKLPLINQANALLGGVLGAVNMLALIYIACAAVSLFAAESKITGLIDQSYLVKYFYNYNILLQLIMKA